MNFLLPLQPCILLFDFYFAGVVTYLLTCIYLFLTLRLGRLSTGTWQQGAIHLCIIRLLVQCADLRVFLATGYVQEVLVLVRQRFGLNTFKTLVGLGDSG